MLENGRIEHFGVKMLRYAIFLTLCATILCTSTPDDNAVKGNATGHRFHRRHHHHHHGFGGYVPPLYDRNVCDLDASVLLVVDGGHHGFNRARRVKCSDVAAADEDSCMVCCQNAARRDKTIKNEDIFGFLTIVDELKHYEHHRHHHRRHHDDDYDWSRSDEYARRNKREVSDEATETVDEAPSAENGTATEDYHRCHDHDHHCLREFRKNHVFRNVKCLCCAPRRAIPPPPQVYYPQPNYGAYQAYAQPQQSYAASGASYAANSYQAPTNSYQAPSSAYQAPSNAYQAPAQPYGGSAAPAQSYPSAAPSYSAPQAQSYSAAAPAQSYPSAAPSESYSAASSSYSAAASAPTYTPPPTNYQSASEPTSYPAPAAAASDNQF